MKLSTTTSTKYYMKILSSIFARKYIGFLENGNWDIFNMVKAPYY